MKATFFLFSEKLPRDFRKVTFQLYNDLTLVVKDSFERMSGFKYFGIIDFDEFLIPAKNRTLKEMLVSFLARKTKSFKEGKRCMFSLPLEEGKEISNMLLEFTI